MKYRFVVLVDFSPHAGHLVNFAYEWSRVVGAELLLAHSTFAPAPALASPESKRQLSDIADRAALSKLQGLARSGLPAGTPVRFLVSEKRLVPLLNTLLQEPYANLVFLGLKGTGMLKRTLLGSEAVRVIDETDSLVVGVPRNADCCPAERLRVAVQKDFPLNILEFNKLLHSTGGRIRELSFFSVLTPADDFAAAERYLRDLAEMYAERMVTSYRLHPGSSAIEEIRSVVSGSKREFLVVQRGSRMLLGRVFRRFLVNELVHQGDIPLIILP